MRHAAILAVALAVAPLLAGCPGGGGQAKPVVPQTPPEVVAAARGTIEQWRQAYQIKGFDVLQGLYAQSDDLVFVQDGRVFIGWPSVEALIKDRLARYQKIVIRLKDINVVALGPTAATATASLTRELGDEVTMVTEFGALTMVLRRDGEKWVIATEHFSYKKAGQ